MNIKDIFDKATSENKSLTWEEFEALAKEGKAKFADLAEGNYVARQKYDDDLAKKDTEISTLNENLTTRTNDMTALQEQLQNAGSDAEKLQELTESLSSLQAKYDADTKSLQSKLSDQAYDFAVRDFASKQKFSSTAARRYFEQSMRDKKLPMENGNIMGATDYLNEYKKENKDSFLSDTPAPADNNPKPQFTDTATGGKGTGPGSKISLSEAMMKKNEDPNFVVDF